jgi:hypothetical protein
MEQSRALKQLESRLSLLGDHVSVLSGKLEDLLFRAQRIAHALKDDAKAQVGDSMFGYDLQNFRRDVRAFGNDAGGLSAAIGSIERSAQFDEPSVALAQAVMRLSERLHKGLGLLLDQAVLAHQHIRQAEHKVEAWYMVQEVESLVQQVQVLPGIANKVLIAVSTKNGASVPPPTGAAPAAPTPQRPASVPLRPAGRPFSSPSTGQQP